MNKVIPAIMAFVLLVSFACNFSFSQVNNEVHPSLDWGPVLSLNGVAKEIDAVDYQIKKVQTILNEERKKLIQELKRNQSDVGDGLPEEGPMNESEIQKTRTKRIGMAMAAQQSRIESRVSEVLVTGANQAAKRINVME